jgi:endo-1,4-beta-xylanase
VRIAAFVLSALAMFAPVGARAAQLTVPGQKLRIRETGAPLEGGGWNLYTNGAVGEWFVPEGAGAVTVVVRAAGEPAKNIFPQANVTAITHDWKELPLGEITVSTKTDRDYRFEVKHGGGPFGVYVRFLNDDAVPGPDGKWLEDRNLLVKEFRVMGATLAKKIPSVMDGAAARIRKHRTAQATLTVTGANGKPLANADVMVRMTRHKFLFGCNIFKLGTNRTAKDNRLYEERFRKLLNFATLPFYWEWYEAKRGKPLHDNRMETARWCRKNGILTKGHPLFWTHEPPWVGKLSFEKGEARQMGRITREIKHFAGVIDIWDVLNEPVVGIKQATDGKALNALRMYKKYGQAEVIKRVFEHARKAGPKATLILNDYRVGPEFVKIIEESLKKGAPIDVIGIQSHMHGRYWGALRTWQVCDRFAKFDKPLHFTETTIVSGPKSDAGWNTTPAGEKKQAEQAVEFYTVLFSHPSVEAITWWDFADQGAWMQAPAGFLRKDMSPKPVYDALMKRIKGDWWTSPLTLKTDAKGRVTFRGVLGDYALATGGSAAKFSLDQAGKCEAAAKLAR